MIHPKLETGGTRQLSTSAWVQPEVRETKPMKQKSKLVLLILYFENLFFFNQYGAPIWAMVDTVSKLVYYGLIIETILTNGIPFHLVKGLQIGNMAINVVLAAAVPLVLNILYTCKQKINYQPEKPRYFSVLVLMTLAKMSMFIVTLFTVIGDGDPVSFMDVMGLVMLVFDILITLAALLVLGSTLATFSHKCENQDVSAVDEVKSILLEYRSLQRDCQPILLVLFSGHTVIVILVGYILTILHHPCVDQSMQTLERYLGFGTTLMSSIIVIGYCGFIMDQAFRHFQDLADKLR